MRPRVKGSLTAGALLAAGLVLGACTSSGPSAPVTARPEVEATSAGPATAPHCGVERWAVKTGTDPGAKSVDLGQVTDTSVDELAGAAPPSAVPADRDGPVETTVYRIHALLAEYKQEDDSDWHLVIVADGRRMVAEIPAPACVGDSPFANGIIHARKQFGEQFAPGPSWQPAGNVPVTVTGVGFYDPEHGQTGGLVLAGGRWTVELHPVLDIQIGPTDQPTSTGSPSPG